MAKSNKITYRESGVDTELADKLIHSWLPAIRKTSKPGNIGPQLGFGGCFELPDGYQNPVLVSSTDGVGTKLKIAFSLNRHNTVGIDLVAMCVNDIIVQGAKPLFFLDYFATGKLDAEISEQVILGIVEGCEIAETALIGGETAEMPGMYSSGEYDLAGFTVGIVEKSKLIDGSDVRAGDVIIGLESSGVHSNGFSLVRKLIDKFELPLDTEIDNSDLGSTLLTPTKIYVKSVLRIIQSAPILALAHITGGGLTGNIERVIPSNFAAKIDISAWPRHTIFEWIQRMSQLSEEEMLATFNCGIGMVAIVNKDSESAVRKELDLLRLASYRIGTVVESDSSRTIIE